MESWEVLIRDHHAAYISWERFLRNQERLRENYTRTAGGAGAPRFGSTLLQGLAHCGRCGRRMDVRYSGRLTHPWYICAGHNKTGSWSYCGGVAATGVDQWVEGRILAAIQPVGIDAAIEAVQELERQADEMRRQWRLRIEQAEYEASLARRRYEAVDPDNRLVAANLESDWEEKLRTVEELKKELALRERKPPMRILAADRQRLHELARDLPRLWSESTTSMKDRKKATRILIREVWLAQEDEPRRTHVRIHWHTGAVTEGYVERPLPAPVRFKTAEEVVSRASELYAGRVPLTEIAEQLNHEGLRTGRGMTFNAQRVQGLLNYRGLLRPRPARKGGDHEAPARSGQTVREDP